MTPEHLPTEQYEAQLAEKVVRLPVMTVCVAVRQARADELT
ncbi:hypothetical protein EC991775_4610, partial [Escherichia coli 99.1775]